MAIFGTLFVVCGAPLAFVAAERPRQIWDG